MAAEVPQFKLNNGVLMPSVGMGKLRFFEEPHYARFHDV